MRLLPWTGNDGKESYLSTPEEGSFLSRLADNLEAVQLGMGADLLDYVQKSLADGTPSETELRNLVGHLSTSLRDAIRVAESRGDRLPDSYDPDDEMGTIVRAMFGREIVL